MTENHASQLCVCGEPSCSGCSCGTDCAFLPGHTDGTIAIEPMSALIEAARSLLGGLTSNGSQVSHPDVRRLNATIAYVEKALNNPTPQTTRGNFQLRHKP
jgi:hypothetical protein